MSLVQAQQGEPQKAYCESNMLFIIIFTFYPTFNAGLDGAEDVALLMMCPVGR